MPPTCAHLAQAVLLALALVATADLSVTGAPSPAPVARSLASAPGPAVKEVQVATAYFGIVGTDIVPWNDTLSEEMASLLNESLATGMGAV